MICRPESSKNPYLFSTYDNKETWMRYWHVIQQAVKTKPNNLLEIGKGNGTIANYLEKNGFPVTTVDFDASLNPTIVCSVIELSKFLPEKSFDTVICSEVLEHLRFEDFKLALNQIQRVCKNYLILTLPQSVYVFFLEFASPLVKRKTFLQTIPRGGTAPRISEEHYWEIGMHRYSHRRVEAEISKGFCIIGSYQIPENPSSRLYLLRPNIAAADNAS